MENRKNGVTTNRNCMVTMFENVNEYTRYVEENGVTLDHIFGYPDYDGNPTFESTSILGFEHEARTMATMQNYVFGKRAVLRVMGVKDNEPNFDTKYNLTIYSQVESESEDNVMVKIVAFAYNTETGEEYNLEDMGTARIRNSREVMLRFTQMTVSEGYMNKLLEVEKF